MNCQLNYEHTNFSSISYTKGHEYPVAKLDPAPIKLQAHFTEAKHRSHQLTRVLLHDT